MTMTVSLPLSLIANAVLLAGLLVALWKIALYREQRKQKGPFGPWPIRKVNPDDFDPAFKTGPLGPGQETEIRFVGNYRVMGGISDYETWVLCVLAKRAKTIFEIGTCTGKTTYLLAANAPAEATVHTLTLPPDAETQFETGDDKNGRTSALEESSFTQFYYEGTDVADKVVQHFGDSKGFDFSPFAQTMDMIFVDGAHTKSYILADTERALAMIKPGGVILWHDYKGPRKMPDVQAALVEIAKDIPLVHLAGTSLCAYRVPES